MEITDKRLWRIVTHDVDQAVAALDLSDLRAFGLDETAAKRGHSDVARARGSRSTTPFAAIIYLIGAPSTSSFPHETSKNLKKAPPHERRG